MNARNAGEAPHKSASTPQIIEWNGNDMTLFDRHGEIIEIESRPKRRPAIRPDTFRHVADAARTVVESTTPVVVIVARTAAEVSLVTLAVFGQVAWTVICFVWYLIAGIVSSVFSARPPRMEDDRTSYQSRSDNRNININITNNINIK